METVTTLGQEGTKRRFTLRVPQTLPGLRDVLARGAAFVRAWRERSRSRRRLATLDDHMLKDIGLSRVDALREAGKRFWQI